MNIRRAPEAESAQGAHIAEGTVGAVVIADLRVADGAGHLHPDMEARFDNVQKGEYNTERRWLQPSHLIFIQHCTLHFEYCIVKLKHCFYVCLLIVIFCYLLLRERGGGKKAAQEDQRQKDCVH